MIRAIASLFNDKGHIESIGTIGFTTISQTRITAALRSPKLDLVHGKAVSGRTVTPIITDNNFLVKFRAELTVV